MVRWIFLLVLFFPFSLFGVVKVEPRATQLSDGKVEGWLVIYHLSDEEVDPNTAQMGDKPIELEFSLKSNWTGDFENEKRSVYKFELPKKTVGIHVLPSFSIKVGEETYSSYPLSYQIERKVPQKPLVLQSEIKAREPLFPGQRFSLVYRILYRGSISIEEQKLPLLQPEGLIKIGPLQVNEYEWESYNVQEFTQEMQGKEPGTYRFPSSYIAGVARYFNEMGKSVQEAVTSQTSAETVRIHSFPLEGKPPSFEGVIGSYQFTSHLASSPNFALGDSVKLILDISGSNDFHTSELPELLKQPGFAGFFEIEDLPNLEMSQLGVKRYTLSLRPTTTLLNEIPSIEFSSFVPQTKSYEVIHTKPIPIQISASLAPVLKSQVRPELKESLLIPDPNEKKKAEIVFEELSHPSKWTLFFSRSHFWDLLFLLVLALFLQIAYKETWKRWTLHNKRPSLRFWQQAEKEKKHQASYHRSLKYALQAAASERSTNQSSKFNDYLERLDRAQFSSDSGLDSQSLWDEGKQLYDSIQKGKR